MGLFSNIVTDYKNHILQLGGAIFSPQKADPALSTTVAAIWYRGDLRKFHCQDSAGKKSNLATEDFVAASVAAAPSAVQKVTATITKAQIAAAGTVTSGAFPIGAPLPASARIVGYSLGEGPLTLLDDPTHATWNVSLGGAGATDVALPVMCSAGQAGFPKAGAAGALGFAMAPQGGVQLKATVSSTVNLSTCMAGNVTVNVFYTVLP